MINVIVNNKSFQLFKQVDYSKSMDDVTGEARIITTQQVSDNSFIKIDDLIEIQLDEISIIKGFAEKCSDGEDNQSHDISFRLRSKIADLLDSSIPDSVKTMKNVTSYKQLCQLCINGIGLDIKVIDNVGAIFDKDLKAGSVGQNIGELLQEYARKAQVFLDSDADGNLIINRPPYNKLKTMLVNKPNFSRNNIKSSNLNLDKTKRFNKYTVRSNSSLASDSKTINDLGNKGEATDPEVRKTRIFEKLADKPMTSQECKLAAKEEANIRRIRSFSYTCSVAGFSANGELWDSSVLVVVKDYPKGVMGEFLIKKVSYTFANGGETTNFDITYPDMNSVEPEQSEVQKRTTKIATVYTVVKGDTLSDIAFQENISLDSVKTANPQIQNPDVIQIGQQIKIPTKG